MMAKLAVNGVLAVDKQKGVTSTDVVRQLKKITRVQKIGHAGALDPMATGLLLICLGEATKIQRLLVDAGKSYRGTLKLGQATDTQDADGTVIAEGSIEGITEAQIRQAAERFVGTIEQIPPMYSALKKDGERLYEKARRGEEVERTPRRVHIHRLEITAVDGPDVSFSMDVSRGTYVRTVAHDLGEVLGCGAHLTELVRTRIGAISLEKAVKAADLEAETWQNHLLSPLEALSHLPRLAVTAAGAETLRRGQDLSVRDVAEPIPWTPGTSFAVVAEGRLVAIADAGPFPFVLSQKRMIAPDAR